MKFFTKSERIGVILILAVIVVVSLFNFRIALRRSRDSQRREDLGSIYNALGQFQSIFGKFPLSSADGKIKACEPDNFINLLEELSENVEFDSEGYFMMLAPCEWGNDALGDITDKNSTPFMQNIPQDPKTSEGLSYFYISNGRRFQIYTSLEGGKSESGYNPEIVERNLACGVNSCNFGRAYANTPLDKSLEEYENELLQNQE